VWGVDEVGRVGVWACSAVCSAESVGCVGEGGCLLVRVEVVDGEDVTFLGALSMVVCCTCT